LEPERKIVEAEIKIDEDEKKALEELAVKKWQLKQKESEEEKRRIVKEAQLEEHEKEQKKREEEEALKAKWEAEKIKKQQKEAEEEKEKEEWFKEEMRHRMAKAGYHNEDIERAIAGTSVHYCHKHHERQPCHRCWVLEVQMADHSPSGFPTYVRVHREHLCTETLEYYGLPWKWDPVIFSLTFHYTV
jgi:alkylation response protein AidB-like acyl-CoA dehydrogenase